MYSVTIVKKWCGVGGGFTWHNVPITSLYNYDFPLPQPLVLKNFPELMKATFTVNKHLKKKIKSRK